MTSEGEAESPKPLNGRQFYVTTAVAVIGLITGLVTVHSAVVMPMIRQGITADMDNAIAEHLHNPHPGAVYRNEFDVLMRKMERIEVRVDAILERVNK